MSYRGSSYNPRYGSSGYGGSSGSYRNRYDPSDKYGAYPGSYPFDNYGHDFYDNFGNYNSYYGGYPGQKSSWDNSYPSGKSSSKRTLLPTPVETGLSTSNLMSSLSRLRRMGGTDKQILDIVQAVVESNDYGGRSGYNYSSSLYGGYNSNPYYTSSNSSYYGMMNGYGGRQSSISNSRGLSARSRQPPPLKKKLSNSRLGKILELENQDKKLKAIPKKALRCHMCNINTFSSREAYMNHLRSESHTTVSELFHSRNSATLQILRCNAKMANIKYEFLSRNNKSAPYTKSKSAKNLKAKSSGVKTGVKGHKLSRSQSWSGEMYEHCLRCQLDLSNVTLKVHKRSMEHKQVTDFISVKCCGKWYGYRNSAGRKEIEEHKLTLSHLLKEYEMEQEKEEQEKEDEAEEAGEGGEAEAGEEEGNENENDDNEGSDKDQENGKHDSFLEKLQKKETEREFDTLKNFPPFDATVMCGLFCIKEQKMRYCKVCRVHISGSAKRLRLHCKSSEHYDKALNFLKKLAEREEKKNKKTNEEGAKDKEGDEQEDSFNEAVEDLASDDDDSKYQNVEKESEEVTGKLDNMSLKDIGVYNGKPLKWTDEPSFDNN